MGNCLKTNYSYHEEDTIESLKVGISNIINIRMHFGGLSLIQWIYERDVLENAHLTKNKKQLITTSHIFHIPIIWYAPYQNAILLEI